MLHQNFHYLVVSNMRSGSSAVARVMHRNMGITMFLDPILSDKFVPSGYYEDKVVINTNELFLRNKMSAKQFLILMEEYIKKQTPPWGLKDGRIGTIAPFYKRLLPDAKIIRLYRNKEDIKKSMKHKWPHWAESDIDNRIFVTDVIADAVWGDNIWASLDMTERRSDEEIENAIRERTREI